MDELARLIKNDSREFEVIVNNTPKYINTSGVWAMFGRLNADDEYICLEVGQSNNIYEELKYDIDCLLQDYSNVELKRSYTARRLFMEFSKQFVVCECDLIRTRAKYRIISTSFVDIKILLIAQENDKDDREKIELEFAVDKKAIFWNAWGKQRSMAKEYFKSTHSL